MFNPFAKKTDDLVKKLSEKVDVEQSRPRPEPKAETRMVSRPEPKPEPTHFAHKEQEVKSPVPSHPLETHTISNHKPKTKSARLQRALTEALKDTSDVVKKFELIELIDEHIEELLVSDKLLKNLKDRVMTLKNEERKVLFDPKTGEMNLVIEETDEVKTLKKDLQKIFTQYQEKAGIILKLSDERSKLLHQHEALDDDQIRQWYKYLEHVLRG